MLKVHCSVTCGREGEICLSPTLLVVLAEAKSDPVGVLGRAALVCLAAALVAARLVQTGRTELSHVQGFFVVSHFYFLPLVPLCRHILHERKSCLYSPSMFSAEKIMMHFLLFNLFTKSII